MNFTPADDLIHTEVNYSCTTNTHFADFAAYHSTYCNIYGKWEPPLLQCVSEYECSLLRSLYMLQLVPVCMPQSCASGSMWFLCMVTCWSVYHLWIISLPMFHDVHLCPFFCHVFIGHYNWIFYACGQQQWVFSCLFLCPRRSDYTLIFNQIALHQIPMLQMGSTLKKLYL